MFNHRRMKGVKKGERRRYNYWRLPKTLAHTREFTTRMVKTDLFLGGLSKGRCRRLILQYFQEVCHLAALREAANLENFRKPRLQTQSSLLDGAVAFREQNDFRRKDRQVVDVPELVT